jgi:hypothetical protein
MFLAQIQIPRKRRRIEQDQSQGHQDLARQLVIGHVEESETVLVERRDVVLQIEHVQSPKPDKRDRSLARDLVPGEVNDFEAVDIGEGGGKVAGEVVVVEKEGFEIKMA